MDGAWPVFVPVHSWEHAMGRRQLSLQPRVSFGGLSLLFLLLLFVLLQNPLLLLCCSNLQVCDCDANHKIRHSTVFLVFSFNPLSYQIFLWIFVILFWVFGAQFSVCFVGVLFFFWPHLCRISFARCRSSDLPFVCWILFFSGFVDTLQSPLSLLITSETCCGTRKLLFCFLSFCLCSGGWRWLWWTCFISCCFDAVFVTSMLGSLNTWQRFWSSSLEQNQALLVSSLWQLAPLAVHRHTRKNTYRRS